LRARSERIGIERQYDPGIVEPRQEHNGTAERLERAGECRIIIDGFVAMPPCLRKGAQQIIKLPTQRQRRDAPKASTKRSATDKVPRGEFVGHHTEGQ
jgi:hypothetical protein